MPAASSLVAPGSASLPVRVRVPAARSVAGTAKGILFGRYARLVGAPNYAPSLRSVAGLLLALALQSGLRGPPPPSLRAQRGASITFAPQSAHWTHAATSLRESAPSAARHRRVFTCDRFGRRGIHCCRARLTARARMDLDGEARCVLGGAPAARAHRLGAPARPNGGCARTLPRRGHPSPPRAMDHQKAHPRRPT